MIKVAVKKLSDIAWLPRKAYPSDAAFDLNSNEVGIIPAGGTQTFGTGIALSMPDNMCSFVLSRSGLAANNSVFVLNSPGLIDPGYRGELKVILYNAGSQPFSVNLHDRIAQLMFNTLLPISFGLVVDLSESNRGDGGLGSTGFCAHENTVQDENGQWVCMQCDGRIAWTI